MLISITRALNELKLLDKRISDKIRNSSFVFYAKKSSDKINHKYSKEEFKALAKSNLDSVQDLIKRRNQIKSAIVQNNATTMVEIGGKEFTVAEAIERKQTIAYEKTLLAELKKQYNNALARVNSENEEVQYNLNELLKTLVGGKDKTKSLDLTSISTEYRNEHEFEIIDPVDVAKVIETLETEIDNFESEVDFVLSESNSIQKIEIPD